MSFQHDSPGRTLPQTFSASNSQHPLMKPEKLEHIFSSELVEQEQASFQLLKPQISEYEIKRLGSVGDRSSLKINCKGM